MKLLTTSAIVLGGLLTFGSLAHAETISFSGTAASGSDMMGGTYGFGVNPFFDAAQAIGATAVNNGGSNNPFYNPSVAGFEATSLTITFTGLDGATIGTDFGTGFSRSNSTNFNGVGAWTTTVVGNTVTFTAGDNGFLRLGDQYDWTVFFSQDVENDPDFAFTATWTGEVAAVPEASTWAMLVIGFAGVGFAGYSRSRKQQQALLAA